MVATGQQWGRLPAGCVQLENCTVDYIDVGSGQPIVLVPGLAGGVGLLDPFIDHLSQKFRVLAPQLRGENWSFCERPFGFEQMVGDLDRFLRALRLERPGLVGVSFGGALALEYAARNPNSLGFLAVQGTGMRFRPGVFGDVARAVLGRLPLPDDNPFINQFFRVLAASGKTQREQLRFIAEQCWRTDQSVMAQRLALLDGYDVGDRLSLITTPTLVAVGDQDVLVHVEEAKELARRLPNGRSTTIEKAGHLAFVTHVKRLGRAIEAFDRDLQIA